MAEVTRERLTRGTLLTTQVVNTPFSAVATELNNSRIERENMQQQSGTFRINLHVPRLGAEFFEAAAAHSQEGLIDFCIPFCLLPLQDELATSGVATETLPIPILTEVGISFEQRGEPAALSQANQVAYDAVKGLDIRIALVEKRMLGVIAGASGVGATEPIYPERTIFSMRLEPVAFSGRTLRLNPFTKGGLNKQMDPYRSYMLMVTCEDLDEAVNRVRDIILPSLQLGMKFRIPLTARDTVDNDSLQNAPTVHDGDTTAPTVAIGVPAGDSQIEADTADGIQTNYDTLDTVLRQKLEGGYLADGDVPSVEHLDNTNCYDIIAVPMWTNFGADGVLRANTVDRAAWAGAAPFDGPIMDTRRFPIDHPFVVHHVVAAINYAATAPATAAATDRAQHPTSAGFTTTIGVLMGNAPRSDYMDYQQVAYVQYTPATKANFVIDRLANKDGGMNGRHIAGQEWDYELMMVPIVRPGATVGQGMDNVQSTAIVTGPPVFVGKGSTKMALGALGGGSPHTRTQIGSHLNVAQDPKTRGNEGIIEVRWHMTDDGGMNLAGAAADNYTTYAGYGGHWVYIICRKALCSLERELPPSAQ
jgi:hypothetical protein